MSKIVYRDPNITVFQSTLFKTNTTVVRTEEVIIVFDPCWLPDEVMHIRHYVDSIREERQLYLVFTHSDYDHIIGYRAFQPDKVFTSKAMAENPLWEQSVEQAIEFDHKFYIDRPYPIEYPKGDFTVNRDGVQYRNGNTKMSFYLTPGHTADSMMIVVWQLGLCIAGDYLSNVEFPFIGQSSVEYLKTLDKLPHIHDRNWFTRLVPGHGTLTLTIGEWLRRRTESLAYIYALRESIARQVEFDESALWHRYRYPKLQRQYHLENTALLTREYEQGLWEWDAEAALKAIESKGLEKMGSGVSLDEVDE
ncbi:MAG TPA: MBL fold metallo-hydrolase [Saprospiraceae bacterium]|nr:MBL fold metallo-hydrolase [Saprospiraceae bacterium]